MDFAKEVLKHSWSGTGLYKFVHPTRRKQVEIQSSWVSRSILKVGTAERDFSQYYLFGFEQPPHGWKLAYAEDHELVRYDHDLLRWSLRIQLSLTFTAQLNLVASLYSYCGSYAVEEFRLVPDCDGFASVIDWSSVISLTNERLDKYRIVPASSQSSQQRRRLAF